MASRVLAAVVVAVVVVYHVLRVLASQCSGAACDWYIPFSLLLPIVALVLAGVAGAYAGRGAGGVWFLLLNGCAGLGAFGPIVAAFLLSDNDTKVWVSTVLVLTVPATIGIYAATHRTTIT